jgi:hypothetical protein
MSDFAQAQSQNEDTVKKTQSNSKIVKTERQNFCIHCGSPLEEGNDFCTECGKRIENEFVYEEDTEKESVAESRSLSPSKIASDRMASIKETEQVKSIGGINLFKQAKEKTEVSKSTEQAKSSGGINLFNQAKEKTEVSKSTEQAKSPLKTGWYIHKDKKRTKYLIIESVVGNSVTATVKTLFSDGSYKTEHYTGSLLGDSLSLRVSKTDLHPLPDERWETQSHITTVTHTILICNNFSGTVSEDKIAGNFSGEFSAFIVFTRK